MRMWRSADSTIPTAVGPPCCSSRSFSREPALTPIRIGILILGQVDDFLDEALAPDVAGIEAEPVHALLEGDERQLVVEVDVGDERDADLALDLAELLGRLSHGHRAAHDLAAGRLQRPDLQERRLDVPRVGLRHRLHGDGRIATHLHLAQRDRSRLTPSDHDLIRGRPTSGTETRRFAPGHCKARTPSAASAAPGPPAGPTRACAATAGGPGRLR